MPELAIIGGTGVYDPTMLSELSERTVATPYGEAAVRIGSYQGRRVAFLQRHGAGHTVPPHRVNYRANIWGLKELGVRRVLATTAVGSCNPQMRPGDFVLIDQFIDLTWGRAMTFFDGGDAGVVHTDFTEPYCPELRAVLRKAADEQGIACHWGGVYVCTQGPRFETPAEITAIARLGGDLVGMTNVPEAVLAREAGLCYAVVSMVTNFGAGISATPLTHAEVLEVMAANGDKMGNLMLGAITAMPAAAGCRCGRAAEPLGS